MSKRRDKREKQCQRKRSRKGVEADKQTVTKKHPKEISRARQTGRKADTKGKRASQRRNLPFLLVRREAHVRHNTHVTCSYENTLLFTKLGEKRPLSPPPSSPPSSPSLSPSLSLSLSLGLTLHLPLCLCLSPSLSLIYSS